MTAAAADHVPAVDYPIVGIGASAGGITALQALCELLPARPDVALVLIQHLPPDRTSRLESLVGKWTSLPVRAAVDGTRPQIDCIYIPSPDHILTLEQGVFRTRPIEGGERRPGIDTIDAFLESLAAEQGTRSIAVILSGTGMDGASGAVRIRQAGGIVLVQDPSTALHDGMPNAVISRGIADHVLPPGALAQQIAACASASYVRPAAAERTGADVGVSVDRIIEFIHRQVGFDLSSYKASPLLWRIQQRMDVRKVATFDDYLALIEDDASEVEALVRAIPIHVTGFFRDPDAWDILSRDVVGPLCGPGHDPRPMRAWSPACSTGEEAYSLAMLLSECAADAPAPREFQVFATDASAEIVARASRGAFPAASVASLSAERRTRFFYSVDRGFRVRRSLREKMVFAPQNLLADPPFTALDIITCRNLLIYLDPDAVRRVIFLLHSALRIGGCLFLGKGEALSPRHKGFEPVSRQWNIYRKTGPMSDVKIDFPSRPKSRPSAAVPATAHRAAVEHFGLPAVLIDDEFRILRVYGDTEKVLRLPEGQPTHDLLRLVPSDLVAHLRTSATAALQGGRALTVEGLPDRETGELTMSVRLTPLQTSADGGPARLLVSFMQQPDRALREEGDSISPAGQETQDAREWRDAVRISHEELEASREELQALNEELRASNDQLNHTNEELSQVNLQLQANIAELEMQSRVLSSGEVITLFLDDELKVRWFTPAAAQVFPLLPGDSGRRITDLVPKVEDDAFLQDIQSVMSSGERREAEVRHRDGRWFLRGIRPYRSGIESTSGVAVTFNDITVRKIAEDALRASEEHKAYLLKLSDTLRPLADAREIQSAAARILGEHLGAERAHYGETVGDEVVIHQGFGSGRAPMIGRFRHLDFGERLVKMYRSGQTALSNDVQSDATISESERGVLGAATIGAYIAVPLVKAGAWVATLAVQSAGPRRWTSEEVGLVEETAERTWAAVERARAEAALEDELGTMTRLHDLAGRLLWITDLEAGLNEVLDAAIGVFGADRGTLQIHDPRTNVLRYAASHGFDKAALAAVPPVSSDFHSTCAVAIRTGQRVVAADIPHDPCWAEHAATAAALDYKAAISAPMKTRREDLQGVLTVHFREPFAPTDTQLRWIDLYARLGAHLVERGRTEAALRESEEKYRSLFDTIDEGFCIIEVLFGQGDQAADYRFLEANAQFERQTGLEDAVGKRMRELRPAHEEHWFTIYGEIALTGTPRRFEQQAAALGRWYDVYAFRVGEPRERRVAILFNDISARRHAEEALRVNMDELTRFNQALMHRERRMSELKSEVNALLEEAGKPRRYTLAPEELADSGDT
ncbi:MAG TPA: chemotaxis protein CheB [Burkholderiales bacterium]|nr:chemotaxis protein CheB [Burkholderiales bacterium]